jgi:cytochrome P450
MDRGVTERPPHVDPARVIDFDFYGDPRFAASGDPHRAMFRMAEEEGRGIFWTPRNGGHWFINDHAMLFDAVRDWALFSSRALTLPALPEGEEPPVFPINLDGAEHAAFRLPLMKVFAPDKVRALEPSIRVFVNELIDRIADKGRCDFVDTVSEPMPVIIFMKFMGLDTSRLREFRIWVNDMLSNEDDLRINSRKAIVAMLEEVIAERRAAPQDDLISRLLASDVRGRSLSEEEMLGFSLLLFAAGLDTVANALSFTMNHLARDPALQAELREQPEQIPEAVEEFLRLYGVASVVRVVTRDADYNGARMKAGERVLMMLPVGNYDSRQFPDPDRFDLERENKAHISFNSGPHRCVGSHLARIELTIFLEEWFRRMPNVWRDPDAEPRMRGGQVLALKDLPIIWDRSV